MFIIEWSKEPDYHESLFKDFLSPAKAIMNYFSGTGLTREHTQYLSYGTNTFPLEKFWFNLLSFGGWIFLLLVVWFLWNNFISINKYEIMSKRRLVEHYRLNYEWDCLKTYPTFLVNKCNKLDLLEKAKNAELIGTRQSIIDFLKEPNIVNEDILYAGW